MLRFQVYTLKCYATSLGKYDRFHKGLSHSMWIIFKIVDINENTSKVAL